jgi:hypothetical protein
MTEIFIDDFFEKLYIEQIAVLAIQNCLAKGPGLQCDALLCFFQVNIRKILLTKICVFESIQYKKAHIE